MRPVAIILVVVAVIAASLTAFLAKRWLDTQAASRPAAEPVAMAEVLVAAREIPPGTVLQSGDLRWEKWPQGAVSTRMVGTKEGGTALLGKVARRALSEGEPVSATATFSHDAAGMLAGMLSPGMRAVSIAITGQSAVSGFVTPGDRVDIVLAADVKRAESGEDKGSGPLVRFAAETVLENVKVLAIDQQIARGRDGQAIPGKTATIEVTPKQSELVTAAGMLGQLSLVLRGIAPDPAAAAGTPTPTLRFTPDLEASKALSAMHGKPAGKATGGGKGGGTAVQINRAGQISTQSTSR